MSSPMTAKPTSGLIAEWLLKAENGTRSNRDTVRQYKTVLDSIYMEVGDSIQTPQIASSAPQLDHIHARTLVTHAERSADAR